MNAGKDFIGNFKDGRIGRVACYRRGTEVLPLVGCYATVISALETATKTLWPTLEASFRARARRTRSRTTRVPAW